MSVAREPQADGQPRDVFAPRQLHERAVEPQSHAVAAERHAFGSGEGVGEVRGGHLDRSCDLGERDGFAEVRVQKLLCPIYKARR